MKKLIWIVIACCCFHNANAQLLKKKNNSDTQFRDAVSLLKQKQYKEAYAEFTTLSKDVSNPDRSAYSYFLAASSAHELEKNNEALQALQQLFSRYPNWNKRDEAYYLAGVLHFKNGNNSRALDYLSRITTSGLSKDVDGLKQTYLSEIKSIATLKSLHKQYPNDRVLAATLINAVNESSASKADSEMVQVLMKRFDFKSASSNGDSKIVATEKVDKVSNLGEDRWKGRTSYNVAVLLPFRIEEFEKTKKVRGNQFAYDYYLGMLLAQKKLKSEKIEVKLFNYDVGSEEREILPLLKNDNFVASDLVVGPLHLSTSEIAGEFATKVGSIALNPLSTDVRLLNKKLGNMYLPHPTLEEQIKQVGKVVTQINRIPDAVIFYGESSKDSTMAELYVKELQRIGGKVNQKIKISSISQEIAKKLPKFEGSTANHITLFATDARTGPALMGVLNDAAELPIIATSFSFDVNTRFSAYSRDIYLLDTDYIDGEKSEVKQFRKDYYDLASTLPSVYSYQGYDHLLFFGRMMSRYGAKVKDGISMRRYDDSSYLLGGFNFRDTRENTIFCIRKYHNGTWRLVDY